MVSTITTTTNSTNGLTFMAASKCRKDIKPFFVTKSRPNSVKMQLTKKALLKMKSLLRGDKSIFKRYHPILINGISFGNKLRNDHWQLFEQTTIPINLLTKECNYNRNRSNRSRCLTDRLSLNKLPPVMVLCNQHINLLLYFWSILSFPIWMLL